MTLEQMMMALRGLGLGSWVKPRLGVRSTDQLRLFSHPFEMDALDDAFGEWLWPEDLKVNFEVEMLTPIHVAYLDAIEASMAQPVNLFVCYDGDPVVAVGGLIVSPGWTDPRIEVSDLDEIVVIGIPDSQGRVVEWEQRSLQFALEVTYDLGFSEPFELCLTLGISLTDE